MKHGITVRYDKNMSKDRNLTMNIKKYISEALNTEGMFVPCEINVLITNDAGIQEINRTYRNMDTATDVLSFPMFDFEPGTLPAELQVMTDPDSGMLPLGDMAISLEHAIRQAEEYGHSVSREVGYLTVHSVLHLLGFDHTDEGPMKKQMREHEEFILNRLQLERKSEEIE